MLIDAFITHLENICSTLENKTVKLRAYESVEGGNTHQVYRLAMSDTDYLIKVNTAEHLPIFASEATGLKILSATNSFTVPKVFEYGSFENNAYCMLNLIN